MSTSNKAEPVKNIASTIRVRSSDFQKTPTTTDTSAPIAGSTVSVASGMDVTSASVVIQLDDQDAIRRANEALSGVQTLGPSTASESDG
jgi:hypothetical protein